MGRNTRRAYLTGDAPHLPKRSPGFMILSSVVSGGTRTNRRSFESPAPAGTVRSTGAHNAIVPRVMDLLKQNQMDDVLVLVGGIIPDQDIETLKKAGVAAIFQPGTPMDSIIEFIRANVKSRGVPATT